MAAALKDGTSNSLAWETLCWLELLMNPEAAEEKSVDVLSVWSDSSRSGGTGRVHLQ